MIKNLGYVDPNMYVGYGLNLNWLVTNVGYEYHATRLPLIFLIHILGEMPSWIFGYLFKFVSILLVTFSWVPTAKNLNLSTKQTNIGLAVLLSSPLVVSAGAWTFANSFAMLISLTLFPLITKKETRFKDLFLIGIILTNVLLMNILFGLLSFIIVLSHQFTRFSGLEQVIKQFSNIFLGIVFSALLYDYIWLEILNFSGSIWFAQWTAVTSVDDWSESYWRPISELVVDKHSLTLFLSFIGVGLVGNSLLYFWGIKEKQISIIRSVWISGLIYSAIILSMYFTKLYVGFSEYWYYYAIFPLFFQSLILLLAHPHILLNSKTPIIILLCSAIIFVYLQIYFGAFRLSYLLLCLFLLIFLLVNLLINMINRNLFKFNNLKVVIPGIVLCGSFLGLYVNPTFANTYLSNDNKRGIEILIEQKFLMDTISREVKDRSGIAFWGGRDQTGVIGSLESLLSFHLIRLDVKEIQSKQIDTSKWEKKNSKKPDTILVILDNKDYIENLRKGDDILSVCGYNLVSKVNLPNEVRSLNILRIETLVENKKC